MTEGDTNLVEKKENQKYIYRITPKCYGELDRKKRLFNFEVQLPGVDKDKVILKVLPELLHLEAAKEDQNSKAIYSLTRYFTYEVDPNSIDANYANGLLKFSVKIKDPLSEAVDIILS